MSTNAPRPAPCATPALVVQNNTPYRATIWQYRTTLATFIASVGPLNKQTIPVETKPGHYFATIDGWKSNKRPARDAVRIDMTCPKPE